MADTRVRINTVTTEELKEYLSGIGPEQARLIVTYREEHGYLRGPEDLGRVEGIDRETVAALAPYVDWSVPPEREVTKQREWGWALVAAVTFLAFLWQLAFGSLPALVRAVQGSNPLDIWYAAPGAGILAGLALFMAALVANFLTEDRRRARKAVLFGVAGLVVAFLAYASAALVTASRYLFFDPDWAGLPQDLVIFPLTIALALVGLPVVLVLWRPALAASLRLARLFDVGLALAALALVLGAGATVARAQDDFTPAILFDMGGKFDKSFNEAAFAGAERWSEETGQEYAEFELTAEAQREQAIRRFAEAGNNPVIMVGFMSATPLNEIAPDYPETTFVIVDAVVEQPNVRSVVFNEHEGSYLVGMLAGMASESGKVGFVGGMDIPLIRKFACGYVQGVKHVKKDAEVFQNMTGTTGAAWNDPVNGG